jgi:hypothetical protein
MKKNSTTQFTDTLNEDRIEDAFKQYKNIEENCSSFKNLIMSEAKSAGLIGSPSFDKLLRESANKKNVHRGGSEDSRPRKN